MANVTIVCDKSGLSFEAPSRRSKNHPKISAWLSIANTEGWYSQALTAIKTGREAGLNDITEFVSLLKETQQAAQAQEEINYAKRITEYRQRKAEQSNYSNNPHFAGGNEDIDLDRMVTTQL